MEAEVFSREPVYLETGSTDPAYNLAFEEYLLTGPQAGEYLILWQNENAVVVGQNQNTAEEIDRAFVEAHGIHVVRRTTGGGAVYHDLGNLNYSFITRAGNTEDLVLSRFTQPVVRALRALGLEAEASGRNDILVSGKKVSGTAQRLYRDRILHHGTLLFDTDPNMVAGALNADLEKFRSKSAKSVRSRVGNIREHLARKLTLQEFWDHLKMTLVESGVRPGVLGAEALARVEALRREKYDDWEWNYGRSPEFDQCSRRRWGGGSLEVRLTARQGCIREIRFYGDFLALRPLDRVTELFRNCPLRREDLARRLEGLPLREYFGGITEEELLETILA